MSEPIITVRNLDLFLERRKILRDISLTVDAGEYLSVIGPNGAGKTSLIKCLVRIYSDWRGSITARGRDLRKCSRRESARLISYVPQADDASIPFTGLEFVLMARYPHLSPFTTLRREDRRMAERCLDQTDTAAFRDRPLNTLSGGERRMVMIAAALAQGADIMLLDEPAAFLDYRHQHQVYRLLGDLNRRHGLTVIAVNHDVNAACRWSSRIAALRDGRLLFCKPSAEVLDRAVLAELYHTGFTLAHTPSGRRLAVAEDDA